MNEKNRVVQKSLTIEKTKPIELPRPLEEVTEVELLRKRAIGKVTTSVLNYLSGEFTANGYEWLLPVVFSQSTDPLWPDQNASIEKRVEIEIYGKTVRPTASMIIHKLVACSLAHPRLFILSPNVRIEKAERSASSVHAYEFTQLDFEARNMSSEEIRSFVEMILCGLMTHLRRNVDDELFYLRVGHSLPHFSGPFKTYDREMLQKEHGSAWESQIICECDDKPFWVTNFPREFYDFEDFETGKWDNYDLFLPAYGEVLSGARREFEYKKIAAKMERVGVRKENYQVLLKLAKEGKLKPSAGAGIGLERLISWVVEAKQIGEVQLFPRIPGTVYEL
jgi:asparaginyl-tRNA synthetase